MSIDNQNEPKISHYLGIDYGIAMIGLAVADSETKIASAYITLKNNNKLLDKLSKIIQKKEINLIILGFTDYRGQIDAKKKFGQMIAEKLNIKVEYQNEMFTTKIAQSNLIAKGVRDIKKYDNQEAARIILQSWLDKNIKKLISRN
mgnify:CR=1 FL=1